MNSKKNNNIDSATDLIEFKNFFDESTKDIMRNIVKEEFGTSIKDLINESRINEADEDEDEQDVNLDTDVVASDEESTEDFDLDAEEAEESEEEIESDEEMDFSDSEDEEMDFSEFDKYKVDDDTYDLRSDVTGEDAVKIFKLMKDDDQIITVNQEGDKINIKDYENDNEYMVIPNDGDDELEFSGFDMDDEYDLNESRLLKILNEIDLGYTDNYQEKTAMTTDGVSEPATKQRTWDKGAPTSGDETRRYGEKGKSDPYTEVVTEEFDMGDDFEMSEEVEGEETNVEEGGLTRTKRNLRQTASLKSEPQVKYTQGVRVDKVRQGAQLVNSVEESKKLKESEAKYKKLLKEYVEIKDLVVSLSETLKESMLHQTKLAKVVKLVTENTTTAKEKIEIINRFDSEVKTKEDANKLYESINNSLKKSNVKNINENITDTKTVLKDNKSAGETVLYESKEISNIKSLMERMNK